MTRWDMPGGRVSSITPSCAASLVASMILPGVSSGTVREPMRRAKRYWSASPIDTDLISSDPHSGIYGAWALGGAAVRGSHSLCPRSVVHR